MDENTTGLSLADYYTAIKAEHEANNAWSAEQAQKAMDYQTEMSNTAHQREVADLKAAGLNPVLSAGGQGATTGSGIAAQRSDENVQALYGLIKESMKTMMNQANAMQNTAKYISGSVGSSNSSVKKSGGNRKGTDSIFNSEDEKNIEEHIVDAGAQVAHKIFGVDVDTAKAIFDKGVELLNKGYDSGVKLYQSAKNGFSVTNAMTKGLLNAGADWRDVKKFRENLKSVSKYKDDKGYSGRSGKF